MSELAARGPRLAFLLAAGGAIVATQAVTPSPALQAALLVPLVAVLGVPHGALDVHMARRLWPLDRPAMRWAFGSGYLAVAAGVLVLWLLQPAIALAAFLIYSAAHFAGDWRAELAWPVRLAAGSAVVALPAWRFDAQVSDLFALLASPEAAVGATSWLATAAPWLALAAVGGAILQRRWGPATEMAALGVLAAAVPPLIYFVIYFCGLHSPRHFIETLAQLGLGVRAGVAAALPLTALTLVLAGVAATLMVQRGVPLEAVALETVFIGLAALAVPHMVLVERFWTRRTALVPAQSARGTSLP